MTDTRSAATPRGATPAARASRRRVVGLGAAVAVVVGAVLLYLFQPWALVTTTTVDEALPDAAPPATAPSMPPSSGGSATSPSAASSASASPTGPVTLSRGTFRSYEHETTGKASLVRVDGTTYVRLTDFATSNGPDVKVWLTKAGVDAADQARDAGYVDLGDLKGNRGNQNYLVPAAVRLSEYRTVVIWCDRFSVAFGAAGLAPA